MSEKQREAFEVWASRHHGVSAIGKVGEHYSNTSVGNDWFVWQAAIASVIVSIPEPESNGILHPSDVKAAIEQAGVSYEQS